MIAETQIKRNLLMMNIKIPLYVYISFLLFSLTISNLSATCCTCHVIGLEATQSSMILFSRGPNGITAMIKSWQVDCTIDTLDFFRPFLSSFSFSLTLRNRFSPQSFISHSLTQEILGFLPTLQQVIFMSLYIFSMYFEVFVYSEQFSKGSRIRGI